VSAPVRSTGRGAACAARIDARLPQTQCGRCGYDGCRPYAEAVSRGEAALNRCPPGGEATVRALAALTGLAVLALEDGRGAPGSWFLARIDESRCIGCTLCIQACPVDAILGARRRMHTVIESECTGCERCLAPCPVDCIDRVPMPVPAVPDRPFVDFLEAWLSTRAPLARRRYERRQERRRRRLAGKQVGLARRIGTLADRRAAVESALARVRARPDRQPSLARAAPKQPGPEGGAP
jgi:electron transport complex protein RnfB